MRWLLPVPVLLLALLAGCTMPPTVPPPDDPAPPPPATPFVDACHDASPCPLALAADGSVMDIAVHPADPAYLAVASLLDVATSGTPLASSPDQAVLDLTRDAGATWTRILVPALQPNPSGQANRVHVAIAADGSIGVLTDQSSDGGRFEMLVTRDGGATWATSAASGFEPTFMDVAAGMLAVVVNEFDQNPIYLHTGTRWERAYDQPDCGHYTRFRALSNGTSLGLCAAWSEATGFGFDSEFFAAIQPFWVMPDGRVAAGLRWQLPGCAPVVAIAMPWPHLGAIVECEGGALAHVVGDVRDGSFESRPLALPTSTIPDQNVIGGPLVDPRVVADAQEPDGTLRLLVRHDDGAGFRLEELRVTPALEPVGRRDLVAASAVFGAIAVAPEGGWVAWRADADPLAGWGYPLHSQPGPVQFQRLVPAA